MKVSRALIFVFFILFISFFTPKLQAQNQSENFKLKGAVADLNTGKPLAGVTVLISSRTNGQAFTGTTTDEKGFFTINNIPESKVRAKFSMVGYQTQVVDSISLENTSVLGLVKLRAAPIVMPEVVIKSLKPMVEYQVDRKVINMDMVPGGGTGSVTDALRNSGAVDVDPSTNAITVRGQSVKLQIDGHPFTMPNDALAQMPADMIDQVEVILAPGAKESAEGGAYILNMISKKNTLDNYNGSISLSASSGNRNYGGVNLNYKVNKINVFGSFFGGLGESVASNFSDRINYFSSKLHFQNTSGRSSYDGYMGTGKLGLDYTLDDNNLFTFYGTFSRQKGTSESKGTSIIRDTLGISQYYYENNNSSDYTYDNLSFYGFYKKKFEAKGHELIIDALFTKLDNPAITKMNTLYNYRASMPQLQNSNNGVNANTFILKADYVYPMKSGKLEAGYNFTTRFRENDYNVLDYSYSKAAWLDSMKLTNRFRYTEDIQALYTTYSQRFDKWEIKAGLRMENLSTHGQQFKVNEFTKDEDFSENYLNLFPDLNVAYKITDMYQITFNTFRRVKYPQLYYVNPFRVYNSPNSFDAGNPKLKPYFLNSYSLNFAQYINFYYVYSNGMFNGVSAVVDDSVTMNSYINIGTNKTYGFDVTLPYFNSPAMPFHLPDFITMMNIRFEYMWRRQEGAYLTEDLNYTVKRPSLNANLGLKLWYDINASLYLMYVPATENRREKNSEMKYLSLFFSKSILDQKLRISVSLSDVLNAMKYDSETSGSNFYSRNQFRMENSRSISLSLSYMFNDYKERRDRNLDDGRDASGKSTF